MGKTKTAFVSDNSSVDTKTSAEKYAEKKAKKAAEAAKAAGTETVVEETAATEPVKEVSKKAASSDMANSRSKKYMDAKAKYNHATYYKPTEAIKLVKEITNTKFDSTLEVHLVVKKQGLSASVTLPNSFGKAKKVEVADDSTIEKLKAGKIEFDVLLATPEMMPKLVMFARLLGPRGLMPNPKNGTVIKKASDAEKFSTASIALKTEKEQPLIHVAFGKVSMNDEDLAKNLEAILNALAGTKQVVRAFVKSTMSPSVKLQLN